MLLLFFIVILPCIVHYTVSSPCIIVLSLCSIEHKIQNMIYLQGIRGSNTVHISIVI